MARTKTTTHVLPSRRLRVASENDLMTSDEAQVSMEANENHFEQERSGNRVELEILSSVESDDVEVLEGNARVVNSVGSLYSWVLDDVLRRRSIFRESPTSDLSFL